MLTQLQFETKLEALLEEAYGVHSRDSLRRLRLAANIALGGTIRDLLIEGRLELTNTDAGLMVHETRLTEGTPRP